LCRVGVTDFGVIACHVLAFGQLEFLLRRSILETRMVQQLSVIGAV
jgi:hypothetical protein